MRCKAIEEALVEAGAMCSFSAELLHGSDGGDADRCKLRSLIVN